MLKLLKIFFFSKFTIWAVIPPHRVVKSWALIYVSFIIYLYVFLVLLKDRTFTWEIIRLCFLLLCNNVSFSHSLTSLMQIVGVGVLSDGPVNLYKNKFIFHVVSHHLSYVFPGITYFSCNYSQPWNIWTPSLPFKLKKVGDHYNVLNN